MARIFHLLEIYTDNGSVGHEVQDITNASVGLQSGIFRFITGRPRYDGSTVIPVWSSSEINLAGLNISNTECTDVFYEGILQKQPFVSFPASNIDITKSGDVGTLSGMEFIITNSKRFWLSMRTLDISLTGRLVRYIVAIDDILYCRWVGDIKNNPYNEVDYKFVCEPLINMHRVIPPKVINKVTFPDSENGFEQKKSVMISDIITPESLIPANASTQSDPLPCCFGDILYAQLFNVEGSPKLENIMKNYEGKFFKTTVALAPGYMTDDGEAFDPGGSYYTNSGSYPPGSGWYAPGTLHIHMGGTTYFVNTNTWEYVLVLGYGTEMPPYGLDYFKDYYVYKREEQKGIRIKHSVSGHMVYNGVMECYAIFLFLYEGPDSFTEENMLKSQKQGIAPIADVDGQLIDPDKTTFWEIGKSKAKYVVSTMPITAFNKKFINGVLPEKPMPILNLFNEDIKKYESVSEIVEKTTTSLNYNGDPDEEIHYPYMQLKTKSETSENGINVITPIIIPSSSVKSVEWKILSKTTSGSDITLSPSGTATSISLADVANAIDRDRATIFPASGISMSGGSCGYMLSIGIDISYLVDTSIGKAYFGMDFIPTTSPSADLYFGMRVRIYDNFSNTREIIVDDTKDSDVHIDRQIAGHATILHYSDNKLLLTPSKSNLNIPFILTSAQQGPSKYLNFLSNDFYVSDGNTNNEDDNMFQMNQASMVVDGKKDESTSLGFGELDLNKLVHLVRNQLANPILYVDFYFITKDVSTTLNVKIKQFGFVTDKVVATDNKKLFCEVAGEKNLQENETNNAFWALQHLVQSYDGISTSITSFGNLSATRGAGATYPWYVGKQILEKKGTLDYIQELCKHCFIGYYLDRHGKHSFSAWIENTTTSITHDENLIIPNTMTLEETDISEIFNDFSLRYNWNPGLGKYDKTITITHQRDEVDVGGHAPGGGFPDIAYIAADGTKVGPFSDAGVPLWEEYCNFPGIPKTPTGYDADTGLPENPEEGDSYLATAAGSGWEINHYYVWHNGEWDVNGYSDCYDAAKGLWQSCRDAYIKTICIQAPGNDLTELSWFIDRSLLSDIPKSAQGISFHSTAFMYAQKLVSWLSVKKKILKYQIPLTTDTVTLDLLQPINVKDYYFTNNDPWQGWIVGISPGTNDSFENPADVINLTVILNPTPPTS